LLASVDLLNTPFTTLNINKNGKLTIQTGFEMKIQAKTLNQTLEYIVSRQTRTLIYDTDAI